MTNVRFESKIIKINNCNLVRLPLEASKILPSRGMVMVEGTISNVHLIIPLEPDGKGSHWFYLTPEIYKQINSDSKTVTIDITPVKSWPDPKVPKDLQIAVSMSTKVNSLWKEITPMARWDWIRWISGTKQAETRSRRISTMCSKLLSGERRPCCFNRNMCTDPNVSHNGVLLGSSQ